MTDVPCCPECGTELTDEAFSFWCPGCQRTVSYAEAIAHIDGDPDD